MAGLFRGGQKNWEIFKGPTKMRNKSHVRKKAWFQTMAAINICQKVDHYLVVVLLG